MTRRIVAIGIAIVALFSVSVWAVWPRPVGVPSWITDYDIAVRAPQTIAPGTVIDRSPPAGWSHLVLKSLPRVRDEHRSKLNGLTVRMAAWMFTAIVADVRRIEEPNGRFHLRSVALGLGAAAEGRDTIVTPETAEQFGIEMNWFKREILKTGYETQAQSRLVVHGPTFGLMDTPVSYRCGERNRSVRFRYALLVDGLSGRLDVLVWLLDGDGGCGNVNSVAILAPNTVDPVELIPDMEEFRLGIPSDKAFGVDRLPQHHAHVLLSPDVQALAVQPRFTAEDASTLETHLRRLLDAQH